MISSIRINSYWDRLIKGNQLKKYKFTPACLPSHIREKPEFEQNVICIALQKLISSDYYDITAMDKLSKLFGISKRSGIYDYFSLMHCVHYKDMGEDVAEELINKSLDYLGVDIEVIDSQYEDPTVVRATDTIFKYQEDGYPSSMDEIMGTSVRKLNRPRILKLIPFIKGT